jgi:hypothetical protein
MKERNKREERGERDRREAKELSLIPILSLPLPLPSPFLSPPPSPPSLFLFLIGEPNITQGNLEDFVLERKWNWIDKEG